MEVQDISFFKMFWYYLFMKRYLYALIVLLPISSHATVSIWGQSKDFSSVYRCMFYFLMLFLPFILIDVVSFLLKSSEGRRTARVGIKVILLCTAVAAAFFSFTLQESGSGLDQLSQIPGVGFN